MSTGYFGVPGRYGGLTHYARTNLMIDAKVRPLCGTRVHPKAEFQWSARWDNMRPECERCQRLVPDVWYPRV